MSAVTVQSADWCEDFGDLTLCGTRMVEYARRSFARSILGEEES